MECYCCLKMSKTSWQTGKLCNSERDKAGIRQFGKKVLPGIFLGYALIAGEFGKETFWLLRLKKWKRWTHQKSTLRDSMQRKC